MCFCIWYKRIILLRFFCRIFLGDWFFKFLSILNVIFIIGIMFDNKCVFYYILIKVFYFEI